MSATQSEPATTPLNDAAALNDIAALLSAHLAWSGALSEGQSEIAALLRRTGREVSESAALGGPEPIAGSEEEQLLIMHGGDRIRIDVRYRRDVRAAIEVSSAELPPVLLRAHADGRLTPSALDVAERVALGDLVHHRVAADPEDRAEVTLTWDGELL